MHCTKPNVLVKWQGVTKFLGPLKRAEERRYKYLPGLMSVVGCKRCPWCRLNRSREVATRLMHEAKAHVESWFFTLTYEDGKLPQSPGGATLDRTRITRLRKDVHQDSTRGLFPPFKFFAVGEYGDRTGRPHYHGVAFVDHPWATIEVEPSRSGARQFVCQEFTRLWPEGRHRLSALNFEFAAYAARYAMKKQFAEAALPHYGGRVPEFSSWCHGLGRAHFDRFRGDMYPSDECVVTRGDGTRVPMLPPVLYDRWMDKVDPEVMAEVRAAREKSRYVHTEAEWFGLLGRAEYDADVARVKQRKIVREDL